MYLGQSVGGYTAATRADVRQWPGTAPSRRWKAWIGSQHDGRAFGRWRYHLLSYPAHNGGVRSTSRIRRATTHGDPVPSTVNRPQDGLEAAPTQPVRRPAPKVRTAVTRKRRFTQGHRVHVTTPLLHKPVGFHTFSSDFKRSLPATRRYAFGFVPTATRPARRDAKGPGPRKICIPTRKKKVCDLIRMTECEGTRRAGPRPPNPSTGFQAVGPRVLV